MAIDIHSKQKRNIKVLIEIPLRGTKRSAPMRMLTIIARTCVPGECLHCLGSHCTMLSMVPSISQLSYDFEQAWSLLQRDRPSALVLASHCDYTPIATRVQVN